jgi:hypothetical protein
MRTLLFLELHIKEEACRISSIPVVKPMAGRIIQLKSKQIQHLSA